jgi:hypothetical protein
MVVLPKLRISYEMCCRAMNNFKTQKTTWKTNIVGYFYEN